MPIPLPFRRLATPAFFILVAAVPVNAQHAPGVSAAATVVTGFERNAIGLGVTARIETPVLKLTEHIALVAGASAWTAWTDEGDVADASSKFTDSGIGGYVGFALAPLRSGGAMATVTTGIEWLDEVHSGCGFVPPGGCPPPPEIGRIGVTLAFRVHSGIGSGAFIEGGVVLGRHELQVEPRWGGRFELGLRFSLRR